MVVYDQVILANLFRIIIYYNPSELIYAVYLLINKLRPDYENVEVMVVTNRRRRPPSRFGLGWCW